MFFLIPTDDNEERWKWLLSQLCPKEMRILFQEAYAILNNKDDAEEVLHNALLKGFSKCHQLRDESKAFYWMVKIVRNEAYTYYKRFSVHTFLAQAKLLLTKPPYDDSAEYLFIRKQQNAIIKKQSFGNHLLNKTHGYYHSYFMHRLCFSKGKDMLAEKDWIIMVDNLQILYIKMI